MTTVFGTHVLRLIITFSWDKPITTQNNYSWCGNIIVNSAKGHDFQSNHTTIPYKTTSIQPDNIPERGQVLCGTSYIDMVKHIMGGDLWGYRIQGEDTSLYTLRLKKINEPRKVLFKIIHKKE